MSHSILLRRGRHCHKNKIQYGKEVMWWGELSVSHRWVVLRNQHWSDRWQMKISANAFFKKDNGTHFLNRVASILIFHRSSQEHGFCGSWERLTHSQGTQATKWVGLPFNWCCVPWHACVSSQNPILSGFVCGPVPTMGGGSPRGSP